MRGVGEGEGEVRFRVWDLCGSVRGVWLVGLLGVLFQSWDVSCLEGGDVVAAAVVEVVVVVEAVVAVVAEVVVVAEVAEVAEEVEVSGDVEHFVIEVAVVVRIMAVGDHSRALEQ